MKSVYNILGATFNLALFIGVLNAGEENAVAVYRDAVYKRGKQRSEMEISRRAGGNSRYLGAFRKLALWVEFLIIIGGFIYIGQ